MLSQTIQVARYYSASSNACLDRNRPSVPASPASESATNAISVPPIKQPGLREISSRGFCMSVPTSESAIKVQQFGSRSGLRGPSTPNKGRWNTGHTIQIGFVVDIPREKTSSRATPSPVRTIKNLEGVIPARRQDANAQISADIGASSAAGCLLEDVLSSFASKDRPQLPTMAKSFEKVPNTLNMSFNKLGNDCDMRLHILDGCNKYLSQSTHFIHLTAGEQRGEGTATFNIPKPVAFVSPTIQHIYNGSVHFIEGVENVIRFPTVDRDVLADIVAFLYWDWCRIHLPEIYKALGLRSEEKGDIAEATPGYRPKLESVLELMEAAVYLDLPILVGKCADVAAENIEGISSFGTLPRPLLKSIVKRLPVGDLALIEGTLINRKSPTLLDSECEQSANKEITPRLNTRSIWYQKLSHLVNSSSSIPCVFDNDDTITQPEVFSQARRFCIQRFVEESLRSPLPLATEQKVLKLVEGWGMHIQELHLIPSCTLDAELLRLWLDVMHHLPALKKLSLSITAVSGSAAGMLRTLVSETSATECQCLLKCSDATAVGNLLRLAHNTEPGLSNISALPSPNTKTGWPAMIPAARIVVADTPARMTDTPTSNDTHTTLHLTLQHAVDAMSWEKAAVIINSLSTVSKITGLGIHRWHSFTEQIVLELLTSIMSRKCHLVHIAVPGLNLGALQVAAFCDGLKCASSIQSLDLSGNIRQNDESALLAASSLGQLLSSARSKITKILLAGNFFTSRGLNVIFAAIKSNRDLRHLGISHMDLNSSLLALGETLVSRVATLDFLDVSSSSLLPRTIRDFACFLEETEDARLSISELRMDGLHFIQTVPQSINSLLPRCCTSLKRLSLEGSNDDASDRALGDIGMSTITSALAELHCLLYLSLARQQLSDKSIKCVLDVIKATGVKRVKMGHNRIGTRGLKVLVEGLRCLLTAESDHVIVDLEQNFIPKEALRYPGGVLNEKHYTVMLMRQRI